MSDDEVTSDDLDQGLVYGARLTPEPGWLRRFARRLRRRLAGNRPDPYEVVDLDLPADVVVYFADDPSRAYQLEQWLPAFEALNERRRVILVLRNESTVRLLRGTTSLPVVFIRTLRQLMDLYAGHDYRVALYVNHSRANFQSLMAPTTMHVHVNHGESDKRSSYSNQVRAYNRVYVAGENAASRYREVLLDLGDERLVQVGRPQLDVVHEPAVAPSTRRTLLYAPTWEGETEDNNWTSLDVYGREVVRALLGVPGARVLYKPHPRVTTTTSQALAAAHADVLATVERAAALEPEAGHQLVTGEILGLLPLCDLVVSDVSTVALDFLYLRPDRPLFLTDRRTDRSRLVDDSPLAFGVDVVDRDSLETLTELFVARLADDVLWQARERMRGYYFGDLHRGESTGRFVAAVDALCDERDRAVSARAQQLDDAATRRAVALGGS